MFPGTVWMLLGLPEAQKASESLMQIMNSSLVDSLTVSQTFCSCEGWTHSVPQSFIP